jgi:hypothetical protein
MTGTRPPRISSDRPLRADDRRVVFAARDGDGDLQICVTAALWELLQAEAPLPCDADDRRDHALEAIERRAATAKATADSAGTRMIFIG